MGSSNYPFTGNAQTFTNDFAVNNQFPAVEYGGTEPNALYCEDREVSGTLYRVINATYNKVAQAWMPIDPTKAPYALEITPSGAVNLLSATAGLSPFTWSIVYSLTPLPGIYNVLLYGAKGDGVTDDTTAIQNAINAASAAGGGRVYLPNSTYLVATRHQLVGVAGTSYTCLELKTGVVLVGQSRAGSILKLGNAVQSCVVGANTGANDCGVETLTINGNRANQTESSQDGNQCGLFIYQCNRPIVHDVTITSCQRQGYYDSINFWNDVRGLYTHDCGCEGFSLSNSFYGSYDNVIADACGVNAGSLGSQHSGIYINGGAIGNTLTNPAAQFNIGYGFCMASDASATDCVDNTIVGLTTHNNAQGNAVGQNSAGSYVARNRFLGWESRLDGGNLYAAVALYQANDNSFYGLTVYNAQGSAGVRLTKSSRNRFYDYVTFDNQGSPTQTYGVYEDVDGVNCIENCFLRPYFGGGFTLGAYLVTNTVIQGPVGALSSLRPTTPTLLNSWVANGGGGATPYYEKDADGFVRIHGLIKSGTIGQPAFVLPVGYRPAFDMYVAVDSNAAFGVLFIGASTGNVTPLTGSNTVFSLEGVPPYAGN